MSKLIFREKGFSLELKDKVSKNLIHYNFSYKDLKLNFLHNPSKIKKYNLKLPFIVWLKIFNNNKT